MNMKPDKFKEIYDTTTNAGLADFIDSCYHLLVRHQSNGIDYAFDDDIKNRVVEALRKSGDSVSLNEAVADDECDCFDEEMWLMNNGVAK